MGCLKQLRMTLRKNPNHVMMVQKEKKKRKHGTPLKGKGTEKVFDEPSSSKPETKGKSDPFFDEEYFHCHMKGFLYYTIILLCSFSLFPHPLSHHALCTSPEHADR
jgi:hypothetical protein